MLCFKTWKWPVDVVLTPLFSRSFQEGRSVPGAPSLVNSFVSPMSVFPQSKIEIQITLVIFQTDPTGLSSFQAVSLVECLLLAGRKRQRSRQSRYDSPWREELR